ncbi:hypothetical protein [Bosea sp. BIWAKO-01]|uniref:hypothetical protein n=1 Tax=Bosea sp. BIWAKO-01 TaxID=506668 RepID=UPI000852938F|nr:hypothetical protein [Bosea sp. BIWAKO-01]
MGCRAPAIALGPQEIAIERGLGQLVLCEEVVIGHETGPAMRQKAGHARIPVHPALIQEALEDR